MTDFMRDEGGTPVLFFRGTQTAKTERTVRGLLSYTPSLAVAIIYSARPGDAWGQRKPEFLRTSTVHAAYLEVGKTLVLNDHGLTIGLGDVLRKLEYGNDGIADDEVLKIYNYLHNRLIGKAEGGKFAYNVVDEDGEPLDEGDVPFSLRDPQTLISLARDDFDYSLEAADSVEADTFIFTDAPAVQRAAKKLGYDAVSYNDAFIGGKEAAEHLLGRNVLELEGITEMQDVEGEWIPSHFSVRPLSVDSVREEWTRPTAEVAFAKGG